MICLDTNIVVASLKTPTSKVRTRIDQAVEGRVPIAVPSVVLFELWYGVVKSERKQQNADALADFLAGPVHLLDFDSDDAREAGEIRSALERVGTPIGPYDLLIAAQARRRAALLITANAREFSRVPGLRFADWTA